MKKTSLNKFEKTSKNKATSCNNQLLINNTFILGVAHETR